MGPPETRDEFFVEMFADIHKSLTRHVFWICVLFVWLLVITSLHLSSLVTMEWQRERIKMLERAVDISISLEEKHMKNPQTPSPEWRNRSGGWVSPMGGVWIPPGGTDDDAVYQTMNPELDPPKLPGADFPLTRDLFETKEKADAENL